MKRIVLLFASLLVALSTLNAQAPQYGRFHKSLFGAAAPTTTPCLDGTLYFGSTAGQLWICKTNVWVQIGFANSGTAFTTTLPFQSSSTVTISQGVSPSYKQVYGLITLPASVTGGTQNFKAVQGVINAAASSAPAELWGVYGIVNTNGAPVSAYGVAGDAVISASTPSNAAFGVLGTYDGVVSTTATPTPTGIFSAAVAGQVWDRNTTGPTAIFLALDNGDTNRQSGNPTPAAFKAINRHISFNTGFNYGLDLAIESGFSYGALKADIRLKLKQEIYSGTQTTRNAVRTEVGTQGAVGSVYLSTAGKMYLKVAVGGADTDWQRVTTTVAD